MATIAEALSAAVQCLGAGRLADVTVICQRILAVDGANADALHLWGLAARQAGQLDEAIALLGRAVESRPLFLATRINLANALRAAGRHAQAGRAYRLALAANPEAGSAWHALGGYLTREGGSAARDEAIRSLRRAALLTPSDGEILHDLGLALRYAERAEEGIATLLQATRARPNMAVIWMNLGTSLVESGEHARSLASLRRAVALSPDRAEIHYNNGNARHAAGDLEEALRAFRRSVLLGLPAARTRVAMVLHDLGRRRDAEEMYQRALAEDADPPTAIEQLARLFVEGKRLEEGRVLFASLIRAEPLGRIYRGELLTALADLDLHDGQVDRAAALLGSVRGDGGRFFTVKSIAALRQTLARLGATLERPSSPDPGRPAVTSSTLASLGRFAHNALEYVLVRLYAEKHGFALETPEWVGGYYFEIDDPLPSRPYRPLYYPRRPLNRHLSGAATEPPPAGVDFRSPLFLLEHKAEYRERVRSWLRPRAVWSPFLDPALDRLRAMGDTVVAIHIRRGDFVQFNYPITETAWYADWLRALWPTLKRPVLYIASDDIDGVRRDFAEFAPVVRADVAPDWPNLEFLQDFHVLMHADMVGVSTASGFSLLAAQLNSRATLFMEPDVAGRSVRAFDPWTA
ncbi:tetratricopeptide repeat protein [Azospirillum agricola]|uniref:tetratricopeptide repeat protein n=1 Tax=Azospirillum agricola TaxID=1720247 RepID=UPI000A0F3DA5|nr:tetratricopeptide repeat protein [Azospirillum agricola]SMH41211.1 Flp pilus assembly protein TadD, contains TPR repeats [Azospirillum lipoferum]